MITSIISSPLLQDALTPLKSADYRRLLTSNTLWWQTLFMEMIVVGWLVLELTDSPWAVSLVGFCRSLPLLVVGFASGSIVDRFGRRPVIVAAQANIFIVYTLITLLIWANAISVAYLALASLLLGTGWALEWPARRALLPDLVGKERTVDALLLESFVQGVSRIVGPSLAGVLVAWFGALGCVGVMAGVACMSLLIVRPLSHQPIPRTTMEPNASPWTVLGQGLRYVVQNRPILAVLLITAAMNLCIFPYMALLPVFARDVLQQGPSGLGVLGAATGMGTFLGLFLVGQARRYLSNGWIFTIGTVFQCLMLIGFALSTSYGASWSLLFLSGIGQSCFAIMQSSIILLTASDEMRSRAMGTVVLAIGADPAGKLQMGALAENYGAPTAVGLNAAVAALAIGAVSLAIPSLRTRVQDRVGTEMGTLISAGDAD